MQNVVGLSCIVLWEHHGNIHISVILETSFKIQLSQAIVCFWECWMNTIVISSTRVRQLRSMHSYLAPRLRGYGLHTLGVINEC